MSVKGISTINSNPFPVSLSGIMEINANNTRYNNDIPSVPHQKSASDVLPPKSRILLKANSVELIRFGYLSVL